MISCRWLSNFWRYPPTFFEMPFNRNSRKKQWLSSYPRHAWLNPEPEDRWEWAPSIRVTRELVEERMYPLTLEGLDRAMKALS